MTMLGAAMAVQRSEDGGAVAARGIRLRPEAGEVESGGTRSCQA